MDNKNLKPHLLLLFFITLLSLDSCSDSKKNRNAKEEISAPNQIIPIAEAKSMYRNYSERRLPLIQKYEDSINNKTGIDKKFDVARYVSYDYETIKQYLAYIEEEAKNANTDISTLRFYFSNYSNKPVFHVKDSVLHPRQNSIILSPTLKKGDKNYLFYIENTKEGAQPILLSDSFGEIKGYGLNNAIHTSHATIIPNFAKPNAILYAETSLTMNRGHSAPPNE